MYQILFLISIVISFFLIILILLQPSKQQDTLSLLSANKSDQLFNHMKKRGVDYLLQFITAGLGIIWLVLNIVLMSLGNH